MKRMSTLVIALLLLLNCTYAESIVYEDIIVPIKSGDSVEYLSVGQYAGTDKYTLDLEYRISEDPRKSEWKYDGPEGDPIYLMFVTGVAASADIMVDSLIELYQVKNENGEKEFIGTEGTGINKAGLVYKWVCAQIEEDIDYSQENPVLVGYTKRLSMYVITGEEMCVLVTVHAKADTPDGIPEGETLLERGFEFVELIFPPSEPAQKRAEFPI